MRLAYDDLVQHLQRRGRVRVSGLHDQDEVLDTSFNQLSTTCCRPKTRHFDEASDRWRITTSGGEELTAQFIVAGVGLLSSTNYPNFKGLDAFTGDLYHTARWPHAGVDLRGKRSA